MNILLNGYFDKNFGDDAMQEIVVKHLSKHNLYVNCDRLEMLAHLEKYDNVHIGSYPDRIDMFLNVIGTGFLYKTRYAKVTKFLELMVKRTNKYPRMALVDCSFEHFSSKLEKWLVKKGVQKYDFITCRDKISYGFLKTNVKKSQIFKFNDIVFTGDYIRSSDRNCLGIAPVNRAKSETNYLYYKELARFADEYIRSKNKDVKLFAFDSGNENDILAVMSIKNLMKYADRAKIVAYNSDIDDFVREFAECEIIIGSRFHSVVLAVMNGLKTIAVFDNKKIERLCDDFNITGIKKEDLTAEKLMDRVDNYKHYRIDVSDANGHIKALDEFMEN